MKTQQEILPEYRRFTPQIYAYSDTRFPGQLKIGDTTREDVNERIEEQHPIVTPGKTYKLEWSGTAFYADGSGNHFRDHAVHEVLRQNGFENTAGEWFRCTLDDVKNAYQSVKYRMHFEPKRTLDFGMREEQKKAVEMTYHYFTTTQHREGEPLHFLWNAKMRFGKTFTAYQLAKKMEAKRMLVLTFKPAVEGAWRDDLLQHVDFEGWQFFSSHDGGSPGDLDQKNQSSASARFRIIWAKVKLAASKAKTNGFTPSSGI